MSASSSGDSTPIATNSALNLKASASSSIYQRCTALRERLYRVPEFRDRFVDEAEQSLAAIASTSSAPAPAAPAAFTPDLPIQTDPVSQVLSVLRLGSSLCFLFNRLGHAHQLDVNPQATLSNLKACQRGAAHFIMACKQDLQWPEQDLFAVSELYGQDTNGIVKVNLLSHVTLRRVSVRLLTDLLSSPFAPGRAHRHKVARLARISRRPPPSARRFPHGRAATRTVRRAITRRARDSRLGTKVHAGPRSAAGASSPLTAISADPCLCSLSALGLQSS